MKIKIKMKMKIKIKTKISRPCYEHFYTKVGFWMKLKYVSDCSETWGIY